MSYNHIVVLGADQSFASSITKALAGISSVGRNLTVITSNSEKITLDSVEVKKAMNAFALIIDWEWGQQGRSSASPPSANELERMRRTFAEETMRPPAAQLLYLVGWARLNQSKLPFGPIILCAEKPSVAFTQVALSAGADWVWPSRVHFDRLEAVVRSLIAHSDSVSNVPSKPRVLVVENSGADIARLETELGDSVELSVVCAEQQAAMELSVTKSDVIEHWHSEGPFDAAVVDLALNKANEERATEEVGTDEAGIIGLVDRAPGDGKLSKFLHGVECVQELVKINPSMPIVILSNYVHVPALQARLKMDLGPSTFKRVRLLPKTKEGIEQLKALLENMQRS